MARSASYEAIQASRKLVDCFASLAMTVSSSNLKSLRPTSVESRLLTGQAAAEETVLLRMLLVASAQKEKQDEGQKHVGRNVQIADRQVGPAGKDERKDD